MPELPLPVASSKIKKFYLPSTAKLPQDQQAWIKIDVGFNAVADLESINADDPNLAVSSWRVIVKRMQEWNFVDAEGQPVPITLENVLRLAPVDKIYIRNIQNEDGSTPLSEEKKSS